VEDTDGPLNDYFDENGFSSKTLLKNLGSTFVYFVALTSTLTLLPLLILWSPYSKMYVICPKLKISLLALNESPYGSRSK